LSSNDLPVAELALAEATTPKKQGKLLGAHLESEQPETITPATYTTPVNTSQSPRYGSGLCFRGWVSFRDGKRRSARTNFSYSADGKSVADELVMDKAKKRAAARNLDSPAADMLKTQEFEGSLTRYFFSKFCY